MCVFLQDPGRVHPCRRTEEGPMAQRCGEGEGTDALRSAWGWGGAALTEVVWEGSLQVLHIPETPAPSRQDGPRTSAPSPPALGPTVYLSPAQRLLGPEDDPRGSVGWAGSWEGRLEPELGGQEMHTDSKRR